MDKKIPACIYKKKMCRFVGGRYLHCKPFNIRRNCEAIHLNLAKLDVSESKNSVKIIETP